MPFESVSPTAVPSEKPRVVRCRMYRHEPYAARLIEAFPLQQDPLATPFPIPDACVASLSCTPRHDLCVSPTCGATDTSSNFTSCELPPAINLKTADSHVVLVRFKYGAKEFFSPFPVEVGQAVVTEGDRGEDLGFAQYVRPVGAALPTTAGAVFRVATAEDLDMHCGRAQREQEALHTMRVLARQVKCSAFIQDIMYQLDGHKITVVIARDTRSYVDFRRLQRAAFDVFRCRVWCAYLDEITVPQTGGELKLQPQRAMHGRRSHRSAYAFASRDTNAETC